MLLCGFLHGLRPWVKRIRGPGKRRISEAMGFDLDLDVLPSATDVWAIEEKVWQHWGSSH